MTDAIICYRTEGFHGDSLQVDVALGNPSRSAFDIFFRLHNKSRGKDLTHAKIGMACMDYQTRKLCSMPEEFRKHF